MPSYHQYESSGRRQERQHRYPSYGGDSVDATQIRRESVASDESRSVKNLANQLIQTASFDYNDNRNSYHSEKENEAYVQHEYEKSSRSRNSRERDSAHDERAFLENNYTLAMSQANRRDYGPVRSKQNKATQVEKRSSRSEEVVPSRQKRSTGKSTDRRNDQMSVMSQISSASTSQPVPVKAKKRSVSKKDPSEETIAIFGAYGVTGQYFLQRAMEAGYNIQAMILPGMEMEDVACSKSLRLITGSLNEEEKIREVVENATYVVCLLNDCDDENFNPPIGNADEDEGYHFNNLNFMHNLVPILEHSKTCRVLLYEASSLSKGNRGTPLLSTVVKKIAISKDWKGKKKEQDQIVKYLMHQTQNAHFNYIVTRPSGVIWDRPSRKKLAASKSQPGPFPITNTDLAEFTLNALKMEKVYNSCPFVVQDGI